MYTSIVTVEFKDRAAVDFVTRRSGRKADPTIWFGNVDASGASRLGSIDRVGSTLTKAGYRLVKQIEIGGTHEWRFGKR